MKPARNGLSRGCTRPRVQGWLLCLALILVIVLVPFALLGDVIEEWSLASLAAPASPLLITALVVVLLAMDVLLPVPSSLVGIAVGHELGMALGCVAVWAGLTLGGAIGYALGYFGGAPRIRNMLGSEEVARTSAWLRGGYGSLLFAASRAVPVAAEAGVLVAGSLRMPWKWFIVITSFANAGIAVIYAGAGAISSLFGHELMVLVAGILLPGVALLAFPALMQRLASS